jgi:chemotaxis protein histidine kinase CheA
MCGQSLFLFKGDFMAKAMLEQSASTESFNDVMEKADAALLGESTDQPNPLEGTTESKTEEQQKAETAEAERIAAEAKKVVDAANANKTEEEIKADAEAKRIADEKEAAEATPFVIPEEFKTVFPDAQSPADIIAAHEVIVKERDEEINANKEMVALLNKEKELAPIIKAIASGKTIIEAIQSLENIEERLQPPSFEDKEAYDKYIRNKIELERTRAEEAKEAERRQQLADEAIQHASDMRERFIRGKKISPEKAKEFNEFMRNNTVGDPKTGKLPEGAFDIFWTAFTHKDELARVIAEEEAKRKQAVIDGRIEGIKAAKGAKKANDGLPVMLGGGKPPLVQTEQDKMIEQFRRPKVVVETPIK